MLINRIKKGLCTALSGLAVVAAFGLPVSAQDALWHSYYECAQKQYQQSNYAEAEHLLLSAANSAYQTDESLSSYYYLAHICMKLENYPQAQRYYRIVLDGMGTKTWAVLRPPDGTPDWDQPPSNVQDTSDPGRFIAMLKRHPQKILSVRLAKPITIVDVLSDYGSLLQVQKEYDEAEAAFRQAMILSDCRPDQAVNYEVKLLQKLSVLYGIENRKTEKDVVDQQLADARNTEIPDFDRLVDDTVKDANKAGHNAHTQAIRLNNLAMFCATHGDYVRAQTLFNRALSVLDEHPSRYKRDRAVVLTNYSDLLLAMGNVAASTSMMRQATALGSTSIAATGNSAPDAANQ